MLGYVSLEQFAATAEVAHQELQQYLGENPVDLLNRSTAPASALPAQALSSFENTHFTLGVDIDATPRAKTAPTDYPAIEEFAAAVKKTGAAPVAFPLRHIVSNLSPIRKQANRGTCVSFASTSCYEQQQHPIVDMSEQWLYYDCKTHDGYPNVGGTWVAVAFAALKRDGICTEAKWLYNPNPIPGNESEGPPPPGAALEALRHRVASYHQLGSHDINSIKAVIRMDREVAFAIPVFNSWYQNSWVRYTGDIVMPLRGEARVGGHAMAIVGYNDLPGDVATGGGRFVIRNSWGSDWGVHSSFGLGPGYGSIPYAYIVNYCTEAFAIY
jgi:C1A family cysteine protease